MVHCGPIVLTSVTSLLGAMSPDRRFTTYLAVVVATVAALSGCLDGAAECRTDADCAGSAVCISGGGILVAGGRCAPKEGWPTDGGVADTPDGRGDGGGDGAGDVSEETDGDAGGGIEDATCEAGGDCSCGDGGCGCSPPGRTESFYSGPSQTRGVGICQAGRRRCRPDGTWETVEAETVPAGDEQCDNGGDEDCDGAVDEDCPCVFGGRNAGVCQAATTVGGGTCGEPAGFEPAESTCDDGRDNDCDQQTDFDDRDCLKAAGAQCGGSDECLAGVCAEGRCAHRVFLSSSTHQGDFGGLAQADARCQTLADDAGLAGTWKAILSAASNSARDRLAIEAAVIRTDGERVADGRESLWNENEPIQAPVITDASGATIDFCDECSEAFVWTGSEVDGDPLSATCDDWTSDDSDKFGGFGRPVSPETWLHHQVGGIKGASCQVDMRVYCIDGQQ